MISLNRRIWLAEISHKVVNYGAFIDCSVASNAGHKRDIEFVKTGVCIEVVDNPDSCETLGVFKGIGEKQCISPKEHIKIWKNQESWSYSWRNNLKSVLFRDFIHPGAKYSNLYIQGSRWTQSLWVVSWAPINSRSVSAGWSVRVTTLASATVSLILPSWPADKG